MDRNETKARDKPFGGPLSTKDKNLTAQGRRSGRIKLLLLECLREFPEPNGLEAKRDRGGVALYRRATECSPSPGASVIP